MKLTHRATLGTAVGLLSVMVLGTGLASAQFFPFQRGRVRSCINTYVRHRTTRRVDSRALRLCLRGQNTSASSVSSSRSSGSSMSGSSSSRSSTSSMSSSSTSSRSSNSSMSNSSMSNSSQSSLSSMSSSSNSSMSNSSASSVGSSRSSASSMSNSSAGLVQVSIQNFTYNPTPLVVKKGTTVRWTNNDDDEHTVTRDGSSGPRSGILDEGETFSYTFNNTGTFNYHCVFHPGMHGQVQVTN